MNAFKRCYSNEDEKVSIPYFWEHFDAEHYSIWFAQYKYTEELQKIFMSCNLVNGMFQRLEKMRAQSFASVCVFGTDNDNTISGVWVWRGHDLAFKVSLPLRKYQKNRISLFLKIFSYLLIGKLIMNRMIGKS